MKNFDTLSSVRNASIESSSANVIRTNEKTKEKWDGDNNPSTMKLSTKLKLCRAFWSTYNNQMRNLFFLFFLSV